MRILWSLLALLAGAVVGGVAITVLELLAHVAYPLPPGTDWSDPATMQALMAVRPFGAYFAIWLAHVVGTAAAAWTGARFAPRAPLAHGLAVGLLFWIGGIANLLSLSHPLWFWAIELPAYPLAAWAGARRAWRRRAVV